MIKSNLDIYNAEELDKPSLMDKYDYVMHGKIFKTEEKAVKGEKEKKEQNFLFFV